MKALAAEFLSLYNPCRVCPWKCGVNRLAGEPGKCRCGSEAVVNDYMPHFGEEGCLVGERGSGAIFFSFCNLSCVFCQTSDISQKGEGTPVDAERLSDIMLWLQNEGCHNINLVTPTHVIPSIVSALLIAREKGLTLPIIYNSGGYDSVETLRKLRGVIDIYLPDFKFWLPETAENLCGARNYPDVARKALKEMHRQVGNLVIDEKTGLAKKGLLVRHLVLPGHLDETEKILEFVAKEISPFTYINIMGHYHPCGKARDLPPLNRNLRKREFETAIKIAEKLGLRRLDKTHWHLYDLLFEKDNS